MKRIQLIVAAACLSFLVGCQNTGTAGKGTQESKRLAAVQQHRHQQQSESQQNLWRAQENLLNTDGNPMRTP